MYSISRFQQIIKPIMHGRFQKHVQQHQADKYSKGFNCHSLLISMVYAHLTHCNSLRTLEQSFNAHSHHHYHLNLRRRIRRSTLSEALAKRDTRPFTDMLRELMATCSRTLRKHTQDTADLLYLLDSTPIILKGRGFNQWVSSNGRISGLKVHVLMNHANGCPTVQSITEASVNDIDQRHIVQPEKGATYVFDKGYCDYNWWAELDQAGAYFVTRLKANAAVEVIEQFSPSETQNAHENSHNDNKPPPILTDEYIRFKHKSNSTRPNHYHNKTLRRITVEREGTEALVLVSNNLTASAQEIAENYKRRWQIELLFKWLKQHLKLKRFLGRSANAVKLQLLCAMMAYLLLKLYQQCTTHSNDSLHLLCARIAGGLFEREKTMYGHYADIRRERREWIDRVQGRLI